MDWKRIRRREDGVPRSPLRQPLTPKGELWLLAVISVILFLFWDSPLIQPLKWLTVLFHELSHGLVGFLTGGRVISLNLTHQEGGICVVAGGNRTLTLLAGYPGSLCWGLGALYLSRKDRWTGPLLYVLGALLVLVALFYVRPLIGFGFFFSLAFAVVLGALAHWGGLQVRRLALVTIGLSSCVYVFQDIAEDVFWNTGMPSDATLLFQHTGIPGFIWGLLWYGVSIALVVYAVSTRARTT